MQTLKAICTAAILALALTVPVYAGDIDTPAVVSPKPASAAPVTYSIPMATDLLLLLVSLP
jgi:hypothetical protein